MNTRHGNSIRTELLSNAGLRFGVLLLSILLMASCDLGPEQWEPHVINMGYDKNGQSGHLDLTKSSPAIDADNGDRLEIHSFALQLLPTRRSSSGFIVRTANWPPLPDSALKLVARVSATVRKWQDSGPCFDSRDQVLTEWRPVQAMTWNIEVPAHPWILEKRWDEIRVNIQFQKNDAQAGSDSYVEHTINSVMVRPTKSGDRFQANIGQSIFGRIFDSVNGVPACSQ